MFDVTPSIDVTENEATIRIDAELPGMKEEDVDVSLREGVLTIQGEKKSERDETKDDVHVTERSFGRFQRSFRVPDTIDQDAIEAKMENGVLHITLPKRPEAVQPEKKIPIGKK
jgi:HSP20 family protein